MFTILILLTMNECSISDSNKVCSGIDSTYYSFFEHPDSIVSFVSLSKGYTNPYMAPITTFEVTEKEKIVALILDGTRNFLSLAFTKTLLPGKYDIFCFYNEKLWSANKYNNFYLLLFWNDKKRFYYFMK